MSAQEQLPERIRLALEARLRSDEGIDLVAASDIDANGQFAHSWLVVTTSRILVARLSSPQDSRINPDIDIIFEAPLSRVEEVKTTDFVGNGSLSVLLRPEDGDESASQVIEAVRFSRSQADKFADLSDAIGEMTRRISEGEKTAEEEESEGRSPRRRKQRCDKCGRPFPRGNDFCPYCLDKGAVLLRMLTYLKPYRLQTALALLMTVVATMLQLLPPYLSKILLDKVLMPRTNVRLLWILCAVYTGRWVAGAVIGGLRVKLMAWLGQKVIFDVRTQLYRHLQTLSLSYFDKRHVGAVMSRLMNDTGVINTFLVNTFQTALINIFTLFFIGVILFSSDWKLALLVLCPTPLMMVMTRWFTHRVRPLYRHRWRTISSMNAVLASAIAGVRVVKSFAQEDREVDRFIGRADDLYRTNISAANTRMVYNPSLTILNGIGAVLIWAVGGWQVIHGQLTAGTVMMFTGYMWQFYAPIQQLCDLNDQIQDAATASERILQLLDTQPEVNDIADSVSPNIRGRVEFDHVTFSYDESEGGRPVLHDIDFAVDPGQLIGLVGHSGSGKTTIVNLLLRFYDVNEGEIRFDGENIKSLDSRALREQIGMVLQEAYLFSGTVAENIAYGLPNASMESIVEAARAANAHNFIVNFPDAYDTEVGERGVKLSGGEKQRISIARAVLNDPHILILDEATSSVDTETEALIQEAMERLMENRTTFAIAHRLSTLRNADRLIVLDHGRIAETGTHEELMAREEGVYARLVKIQTEMSRSVDVRI